MFLYNLTLQTASGIQSAVHGNFSGEKLQEILVSKGKVLELLRPDKDGKVRTVHSTEVFGCIRSIAAFRLPGAKTDNVAIASDSGRIIICSFNKERNCFVKLHQETYGKSGCRRLVPGQYLAVDPQGRAIMVGACEKQKLVYVLNRDSAANLTISSPLEAHKSYTLCFGIVALDMSFDNPVFASIELDYADVDADPSGTAANEASKMIVFYELDLGLNHVVRKYSNPIDSGANLLVAVPGGTVGPGGVLICCENFIVYHNQGHESVMALIPRRSDLPGDRSVLITAATCHKTKRSFFFLAQSEYGDIYKVSLEFDGSAVSELKIKYFDTVPPCIALCVLRSGFLFAASEFGNHALYHTQGSGDDPEDVESSSLSLQGADEDAYVPLFFDPRPLKNLLCVDEVASLMPVTNLQSANLLNEETPQLYALCGRGARSSLRVLRQGVAVSELAVSPLPGQPSAVWTLKRTQADEFDSFIVVSFASATLVLSIGEKVEETQIPGFFDKLQTLAVGVMADDSLLQVHPNGIRQIRPGKPTMEWKTPGRKLVMKVAHNTRQLVISLSGGELIYFEAEDASIGGNLAELDRKDMGGDVACMDIGPVPEGRLRSRFLAVGSFDSTVRILSLDPSDRLQVLSLQSLAAAPESLLLLETSGASEGEAGGLVLNVGLSNGVLLRTEVDTATGDMKDTRKRFLGAKPPRLCAVMLNGRRSLLALSSRPWLGYSDGGRFLLSPVSYEALDWASSFNSDQCPEGIIAVAKGTLRIMTVDRLGETFNQTVHKLRYTPRQQVVHPSLGVIAVVEADYGVVGVEARDDGAGAGASGAAGAAGADPMKVEGGGGEAQPADAEMGEAGEEGQMTPDEQFGMPRGVAGQWASCVRVLDPRTGESSVIELENNEAALSCCWCLFPNFPEVVLAVGTARALQFSPRSCEGGKITLYRVVDGGKRLERLVNDGKPHETEVDGIPSALCPFQGRLLVGSGNSLRVYDLGRKKLLRKCEHRGFPNLITSIQAAGDRIYVADLQESIHMCKYKRDENAIYVFADDTAPRWMTCAQQLDYDTVAGADKFGNVCVLRLPAQSSEEVEEDPTGGKVVGSMAQLNGAPYKLEAVVNFHVGDAITGLARTALQPGGIEVLVYATIMGGVGALLPFTSREDVDFGIQLEMHMRQEAPPLSGRDHLAYRSSYFPVKDVIDGDLCEQFGALPAETQRRIADQLERTPGEVMKKLEDMRSRII